MKWREDRTKIAEFVWNYQTYPIHFIEKCKKVSVVCTVPDISMRTMSLLYKCTNLKYSKVSLSNFEQNSAIFILSAPFNQLQKYCFHLCNSTLGLNYFHTVQNNIFLVG